MWSVSVRGTFTYTAFTASTTCLGNTWKIIYRIKKFISIRSNLSYFFINETLFKTKEDITNNRFIHYILFLEYFNKIFPVN